MSTNVNLQKDAHKSEFNIFHQENFPHLMENVSSQLGIVYEEQEWHLLGDIYMERVFDKETNKLINQNLYFWISSGWDRNSSRINMFSFIKGKLEHILNPDEMFRIQSKIDILKKKSKN